MKNKDQLTQYSNLDVSEQLTTKVLEKSRAVVNPRLSIVALKYSLLFLCSLFFSLTVCPQRGVGLYEGSMGFAHHLFHQSEILCGVYCGAVFFVTTHCLSFLLLNHFERLKIVDQLSFLPVITLASFFGLSMTSFFSNLHVSGYYYVSWAIVVLAPYFILNKAYNRKYSLT